jgi:hypothetical protein
MRELAPSVAEVAEQLFVATSAQQEKICLKQTFPSTNSREQQAYKDSLNQKFTLINNEYERN